MSNKYILKWEKQSKEMINKYFQYIYINNKSFDSLWKQNNNNSLWKENNNKLNYKVLRRNIARWNAYYKLNQSLVYNQITRKSQYEIYIERSKYVFILSPFGGGMDCYRTWESLMAGHIIITQNSPLNELYDGLPVVIVNDWNEITYDKLLEWYNMYFFNQTAQNNQNVTSPCTR